MSKPSLVAAEQTYGAWVVLRRDPKPRRNAKWICVCTLCGSEHSVQGSSLLKGDSVKCKDCSYIDRRTANINHGNREDRKLFPGSATTKGSYQWAAAVLRSSGRRNIAHKIAETPGNLCRYWNRHMHVRGELCANLHCRRAAESVDHCHKTGKFRNFLCQPCNMAIGLLLDDPVVIRGAAIAAEQSLVTAFNGHPASWIANA